MFNCYLKRSICTAIFLLIACFTTVSAQPEVMAWGNITGMRVQGQLVEFETSLCVIGSSLRQVSSTAKELQQPEYQRQGDQQTISTKLGDILFVETIEDLGDGAAFVKIKATAESDTSISGAFFCLELPEQEFTNAEIELVDSSASAIEQIPAFPGRRWRHFNRNTQAVVKGVHITSPTRQLKVRINQATEILIQPASRFGNTDTRIYFGLLLGPVTEGQSEERTFTLTASGDIDDAPIVMKLDANNPGRVFDGIGGNFRLQNPETDPLVIDYSLENLDVTWGRVEMPWSSWHPVESVNPIEAARSGTISPRVHQAMHMA